MINKRVHFSFRRRNYFIDQRFQLSFIARFSMLILFGGILTIAIIYFMARQSTTVAFIHSKVTAMNTSVFILPLLIKSAIAVTVVTLLLAVAFLLLISHKIAGPLYRFRKVLEKIEAGELPSEFNIRKGDQLSSLADNLNRAIRRTRERLSELKLHADSLEKKLGSLSGVDMPEYKREILGEVKDISAELERAIQKFKI